jgi:cyanophycinase
MLPAISMLLVAVPIGGAAALGPEPVASSPRLRIDPSGISGSLVICGGGKLPPIITDTFVGLAGNESARIVVIPTASQRADTADPDKLLEPWKAYNVESLTVLHTRDQDEANDTEFVQPLKLATGVWFGGGSQSRIADAYVGTAVENEVCALVERGGVVGGTSAGAAVMSRRMIARGNPTAEVAVGFDLLPGSVIDQHFLKRNRKPRLVRVLEESPGLVGFGIDEETALVVRGRRLKVVGNSSVTVCLSASDLRPAEEIVLEAGRYADLTALRRAAFARAGPAFPHANPRIPRVDSGSLVMAGGGRIPGDVLKRFIELAGGPEALIVVLPTAMPDPIPQRLKDVEMFRQAGARNVKALRQRALADVESPPFLDALKRAGGIWFSGGRQWRFVDAYLDTKAHESFRDVLRRGGVIGGSSAGATIQAEYLVRGHPLGNRQMMAEGYERGLDFLPGVAIDQHFSQRGRLRDMTELVNTFPQLLGIGIDESTALVVTGHVAEVVGRGQVYFYDRNKMSPEAGPHYDLVRTGGQYDLQGRKVLKPQGEPSTESQGATAEECP